MSNKKEEQGKNYSQNITNIIREIAPGYYVVELPPRTSKVLAKVLESESSGYIWFFCAYNNHRNYEWVMKNHPPCFGELSEERIIQVSSMRMDIIFEKDIFLRYLDKFDNYIDVVYSHKPKPIKLDLDSIPDFNKRKVFIGNQIEFYYSLPHPNEYANVYSTSIETLEKFIDIAALVREQF
jgi:hypothetical protein